LLFLPLALALVLGPGPRAWAYDPATTHAGLTQRAAAASSLHATLARRLGRPLGLFEPITLRPGLLPVDEARFLMERLKALDPSGGYRPSDGGVASALSWLTAGSVVAWTPAERGQNSFFDPSVHAGMRDGGAFAELAQTLRLLLDGGGSLRGWATGTNFDLTGPPASEWAQSALNDVGLPRFYDQLELAVAAPDRDARGTALARALLAMGGVLAVLEDAGEPAHVRNDYRASFLRSSEASGGPGPFNRGSLFERFVADSYGVGGVPAAGPPIKRATALAFLTGADGEGLADRTQRRFFSDGTVPEDGIVERDTTEHEIAQAARQSLIYSLPSVPRLELGDLGYRRYVYAVTDLRSGRLQLTSSLPVVSRGAPRPAVRRLLAYERVPGRVRFFLDRNVYLDTARTVLPEIGAYAAGLIDFLLRGEIAIKVTGDTAELSIVGARGVVRGNGKLRAYAENAAGVRTELASWRAADAATGPISVAVPAGTRVVAAVLRAEDDAGVLLAVGEQPVR
jgi:hypothetical protein